MSAWTIGLIAIASGGLGSVLGSYLHNRSRPAAERWTGLKYELLPLGLILVGLLAWYWADAASSHLNPK